MGPLSNTLIRSIERFSGQPKIRKLYFDYVEEDRPYANFWADALDRLNIKIDLHKEAGAMIPRNGPTLIVPTILWRHRRAGAVCHHGRGPFRL